MKTVTAQRMTTQTIETAPEACGAFAITTYAIIGQTIMLENIDKNLWALINKLLQICVLILSNVNEQKKQYYH